MVTPFIVTSSNGDPLAKMARPPVAAWAASAVHSALEEKIRINQCIQVLTLLPRGGVGERKDDGLGIDLRHGLEYFSAEEAATG